MSLKEKHNMMLKVQMLVVTDFELLVIDFAVMLLGLWSNKTTDWPNLYILT